MTGIEIRVAGGIDTHKGNHVAAALDQRGRVLGTESFQATTAGYKQIVMWLLSGEEHGEAKTANGAVESIRLLQVARPCAMKPEPRPRTRSTP